MIMDFVNVRKVGVHKSDSNMHKKESKRGKGFFFRGVPKKNRCVVIGSERALGLG